MEKVRDNSIVFDYVNKCFDNIGDNDNIVSLINDFCYFLQSNNISLKLEDMELLLENNSFYRIVEYFYQTIYAANPSEFYSNPIIRLMVEAFQISFNDGISYFSKSEHLKLEDEQALIKRVRSGDKIASDEFVRRYSWLVSSIAKYYFWDGISFEDLMQEGLDGMMEALKRYEEAKNIRFSTYATSWIRKYIVMYINTNVRNVQLPKELLRLLRKYIMVKDVLYKKLNRNATRLEIATYMQINEKKVQRLELFENLYIEPMSLDRQVSDDIDATLGDMIPSQQESLDQIVIDNHMQDSVNNILQNSGLTEKEIKVLKREFGFYDDHQWLREELENDFGVTSARIGQIEASGLRKMRLSPGIKELAIYMQYPAEACAHIDLFRKLYAESKNRYRTFLKSDGSICDISKKTGNLQSIYELLAPFSQESIDKVISELDDSDKELLFIRYGDDLEHPVKKPISQEDKKRFYRGLVPRIRKSLEKIEEKDKVKKKREYQYQ